tara:strand:- start:956 stop:7285 length:6330 start_codon:yes stop_codon:yes gene_type:complete
MTVGENNPFNIRYNSANDWRGQTGQNRGFANFGAVEDGIRAGDITLKNYGDLHGINNLEGVISRFAPPTENDTSAYVNFVSQQTGIDPTQPIDLSDPNVRADILSAMGDFESGANLSPDQILASAQGSAPSGDIAQNAFNAVLNPRMVSRGTPQSDPLANFGQYRQEEAIAQGLAMPDPQQPFATAPGNFTDAVNRGLGVGIQGIRADINYLQAMGNIVIGDEEGAADAVDRARINKEQAGNISAGSETFEEFWENPTLDGFLMQVGQTLGQVTPFAASTIASSLIGGVGGVGVKLGFNAVQKATAKKLVKDLLEKQAKRGGGLDYWTADEADLMRSLYSAARQDILAGTGRAGRIGGVTGAFGSEYPIMTGESFGEFDEAGVDLDASRAFQSALLGIPAAAVGVAGEAALFNRIGRSFSKVAAEKAGSSKDGLLATFAKNVGGGAGRQAITEGTTETIQEGMLIGQRLAVDDTYTRQESLARLGHAAFAGAIAGSFSGGAGGVLTTVPSALSSGAETARNVKQRVDNYLDDGQEQQVNAAIDREQYNVDPLTNNSPEARSDLNAQRRAVADGKKAAHWEEDTSDNANPLNLPEDGSIRIGGVQLLAAYIKGRGTIFSKDPNVVKKIVEANADEASLAAALGYSGPRTPDADQVVQVKDGNGRIIHEEQTTEANLPAALAAATKVASADPDFTLQKPKPLTEALAERKQRYDSEQRPTEEFKPFDEDEIDQFLREESQPPPQQSRARVGGKVDPDEVNDAVDQPEVDQEQELVEEAGEIVTARPLPELTPTVRNKQTGELEEQTYQANTEGRIYEDTTKLREQFVEEINDGEPIDWTGPETSLYSDALLKKVISLKAKNPDVNFNIVPVGDRFGIRAETTTETALFGKDNLPIGEFIAQELERWKTGKFREVDLVQPNGKKVKINIASMVATGKRLNEQVTGMFEGSTPVESAALGFREIFAVLAEQGYALEYKGKSLLRANPRNPTQTLVNQGAADLVVGFRGGEQITLATILRADRTRNEERKFSYVEKDQNGKPIGYGRIDLSDPDDKALYEEILETAAKRNTTVVERPFGASVPDTQPDNLQDPAYAEERARQTQQGREDVTLLGRQSDKMEFDARQRALAATDVKNTVPMPEQTDTTVDDEISNEIDQIARNEGQLTTQLNRGLPEGFNPNQQPGYITGAATQQKDQAIAQMLERARLKEQANENRYFDLNRFVKSTLKRIKLSLNAEVITASELRNLTPEQLAQKFPDLSEANLEKLLLARQEILFVPEAKGRAATFGNQHLILVDDISLNSLETQLVVAHELGHAFFNEAIQQASINPELSSRLLNDYEKAKQKKGLPEDYTFEEWFADQISIWANRQYSRENAPRNGTEAFFKRWATKLQKLWNEISSSFQRRFGKDNYSQNFDSYMEYALKEKQPLQQTTFQQKMLVRAINNAVTGQAKAKIRGIRSMIQAAFKKANQIPGLAEALRLFRTADGVLRDFSPKIADMFYRMAQESGNPNPNVTGMLKASSLQMAQWETQITNILGEDWSTQENQAALTRAQSSDPTASLTGKAKALREFLESVHSDYISLAPNTNIGFRRDYWPVVLNLEEIAQNPEPFIALIERANPNQDKALIRKAVAGIVRRQQAIAANSDLDIEVDENNPARDIEQALRLTKDLKREDLVSAGRREGLPNGYLEEPPMALKKYLKAVAKRVEWDRHTKDENGNSVLEAELAKLDPKDRAIAQEVINSYLGYTDQPLDATWRKISSVLQLVQAVALLPFAALASFSDLGGPLINSKEFGAFEGWARNFLKTWQGDHAQLARDIGAVSDQAMANSWMTESEAEFMEPAIKSSMDTFFSVIGLNWFTNYSREFATGMGKKFLIDHAESLGTNPRSARYLADLGVTQDDVYKVIGRRGQENGTLDFTSPEGQKVKLALQRFVESSIMRPNAAERPMWASDPRFALIWQLKSFFYAFHKTIMMGIMNEMKTRMGEYQSGAAPNIGATSLLLLSAVATLPLTMLGLELREYTKAGLSYLVPGVDGSTKYFRTDNMSWGTYLNDIVDRSGFYGVFGILGSARQSADYGGSAVMSLLGPTAETLDTIMAEGFDIGQILKERQGYL